MPASRHFSMRVFKILVLSQCLNKRWILLHSERTSILRDEVRSQKSIFNYKKKLKVERKEVRPGIEPGPAV